MTLRDNIISMLEKNKGEYISGQSIADAFSVSRSAVSKCINNLKNEGYDIQSVNNLGHCLKATSDILSSAGISAHLEDDIDVYVFKTIDSTNSEAKRAVANGLNVDTIFASDEQTSGRGRRGRSFYSPKTSGLYFSCVLHPNVSLAESTLLTSAAAVAVCEVIEEATKKHPKIKWVNDIFIDNKKVCGILTEAVSDFESGKVQAVIVGIGINVTTEQFPDELNKIASSVGENINRNYLAAKIFTKLKAFCDSLPSIDFMNEYRNRSLVLGQTIYFNRNGIDYTAKAEAILDDGGLSVITDKNERMILQSGEISIKLN
ncbi:MAG: biotin--[acetyl-CoA-carboxylase] ligase [Clostridia bacterium]|nr:biotin--[acetyl-CoA-carboxylase] ligase [Clostridia bacterium]